MLALLSGPTSVIASWFASEFGKLIAILGTLAIISVGMGAVYFSWKETVEAASRLQFQTQRQAEMIKDKNDEIKHLKDVDSLKDKAVREAQEAVKAQDLTTNSILAWLSQRGSSDPKAVEPESSQVLKDTFLKLYGK